MGGAMSTAPEDGVLRGEADVMQPVARDPGPSGWSLKSDRSMGIPDTFKAGGPSDDSLCSSVRDPGASGWSLKSDWSMGLPENFRAGDDPADKRSRCGRVEPPSAQMASEQTLEFEDFRAKLSEFMDSNLKRCWKLFSSGGESDEDKEETELVDDELLQSEAAAKKAFLPIALHVLRTMNKDFHVCILEQKLYGKLPMYQKRLKSSMKLRYELVAEGSSQEKAEPFNKIYTELIVLDGDGDINSEHEVRQMEAAVNRPRSEETPIKCEDILKPIHTPSRPIRTVLTRGIAGIGKTVLVHKFILDWATDSSNHHIQLLFSIPFRELNLIMNEKRSLIELLCDFAVGFEESGVEDLKIYKVLFILDGLDECRLPLDFEGNDLCCDVAQKTSVDSLLTNLISGNLLPEANVWLTSRPVAANLIPPQYVDRVTEVRGFSDLHREQYFYKKIEDENLAKRVITHVKSTRSLYIMCHVPVFCWISSLVLEKESAKAKGGKLPKTLTQMYIHFLDHQTTQMHVKYGKDANCGKSLIVSLGKLAFEQLEKGNLIFYEEDLRDCGIDVREASMYSGFCTQIFREESCLQHRVFCFVHLSVQEFLAALYVHVVYKAHGVNLMIGDPEKRAATGTLSLLHKPAVDRALKSKNGHLDLFLRFLLGLSVVECDQDLSGSLKTLIETGEPQSQEETIAYIRDIIKCSSESSRCINLFHCLSELKDPSLEKEIQSYLQPERDSSADRRSTDQWAALVFVLLTSGEHLELFELQKYSKTEQGFQKLLPVVKSSRVAKLNNCNLSENSCRALSSTLSAAPSDLRDLNFSDNMILNVGVEFLCRGLWSPHCRLQRLTLSRCSLTQSCCGYLASVLSCPSSPLKELDLTDNNIEDSGVQLLSTGLEDLSCELEILRLSFCCITEKGCGFLASAVKSNPSHLRELDLSYNYLGVSGVKLISEALEEGRCESVKLRVDHNAECWFKPALIKYACELTVDLNTAHRLLIFSDGNRKVSQGTEEQPYPDHPDRFEYSMQVLFQQGLRGRCYWEVEWEGNWAGIGVAYKGLSRKGVDNNCALGYNQQSWILHFSTHGYTAYHDIKSTAVAVPSAGCSRVAVYLDWEAGILSFYRVSSQRLLTHLHTFYTTFTEPLYPGFELWDYGSSITLCQLKELHLS